MIPFILTIVGGYLIGDSMKDSKIFAEGGIMSGSETLKNYQVTGTITQEFGGPIPPEADREDYIDTETENFSISVMASSEQEAEKIAEQEIMDKYLFDDYGTYLTGKKQYYYGDIKIEDVIETGRYENGGIVGKRVKLIEMREDPSPIAPGTMGTIAHVGGGVINVNWDNGRKLGLVEGVDEYEIIDTMANGGMTPGQRLADNSNWTNEELLAQYNSIKIDLEDLKEGKITPRKIIGGGYKSSSVAKRVAKEYLEERITEYARALKIRGVMADGGKTGQTDFMKLYNLASEKQRLRNSLHNASPDRQKEILKKIDEVNAKMDQMGKSMGYADGGSIAESNNQMLMSKIKEVKHHADELGHIVKPKTEVEAWVVAKAERSASDLSDITHYIDGNKK